MSYTVDIISAAIPESYDEALFVRDALADVYDSQFGPDKPELFEPPSSEMTELHRRLTARYPCITESTDGPWSDGPLINNFGQRSATLGISYSRVEDVLPFLIATATDMGFWVLDAQDDRVHLPGGGTLRPRDSKTPSRARKAWWRVWK